MNAIKSVIVLTVAGIIAGAFCIKVLKTPENFNTAPFRNFLRNAASVKIYYSTGNGKNEQRHRLAVLSATSHRQQWQELRDTDSFSPYGLALMTTLNLDLQITDADGVTKDVVDGDGVLRAPGFHDFAVPPNSFYRWTCSFPQLWNEVPFLEAADPGMLLNALHNAVSIGVYSYQGYMNDPRNPPLAVINDHSHSMQLLEFQKTVKMRFNMQFKPVQKGTLILDINERDGSRNLIGETSGILCAPELSTDCAYPDPKLVRWLNTINPTVKH